MRRSRRLSPQTRAVVLALAADELRWRYGYDLSGELDLKAGTLYPILIRLADRGVLETSWEPDPPPGRPARHLYRLSPAGVELANLVRTVEEHDVVDRGTAGRLRPRTGQAGA